MEEGIVAKWRSKAVVGGREYSWLHTVNKKKAAMHEAAEMLLEHLLPGRWVMMRIGCQSVIEHGSRSGLDAISPHEGSYHEN